MNEEVKRAYETVGVKQDISDDELKKVYRDAAKKFHPDIYSDKEKFKKINEAYQLITDYRSNPDKYNTPPFGRSPFQGNPFDGIDLGGMGFDIGDLFQGGNFAAQDRQQKSFNHPPINVKVDISFKESVTGTSREISYKRFIKCDSCRGIGNQKIGNGCKSCDGFGRNVVRRGNTIYTSNCNVCGGRGTKNKECEACKSEGAIESDYKITIRIPAGIENNSTLRLQGAGHYVGYHMLGDASTDVYVHVSVEKNNSLSIEGSNVVTKLDISLLEALTGTEKEVETIFGMKKIDIPELSKNKDEIRIEGCGVVAETIGVERVILNIHYPDNTDNLIKFLKKKEKKE